MKGQRTRASILQRAVDLASLEGLEGLTIGRLAEELRMSKSGLFAHFGSKEELQLAAIDAARQRSSTRSSVPRSTRSAAIRAWWRSAHSWLDYVRRRVFPGGCFFAAASFEFDGRPGPVRDAVAKQMDDWFAMLEKAIRMAKDEGHLDAEVEPAQLAFELNALLFGANFAYNLRHDEEAFARAKRAIERRLESVRSGGTPLLRPAWTPARHSDFVD